MLSSSSLAKAALPPGYEDEQYCKAGHCLMEAEMPENRRTLSGPQHRFLLCVPISEFLSEHLQHHHTKPTFNPRKYPHPIPWGSNIVVQVKERLLEQGYIQAEDCSSAYSPASSPSSSSAAASTSTSTSTSTTRTMHTRLEASRDAGIMMVSTGLFAEIQHPQAMMNAIAMVSTMSDINYNNYS